VRPMEAASPGGMAGQPEALRWLPSEAGTPARLLEGETVLRLGDFRSGP
jgi:hypothetical protein